MTAWQEPENCGHIRAKQIRAIDRYGIQAHHKSHAAGRGILRNPKLVIGGNKGHTHIQQRHPQKQHAGAGGKVQKEVNQRKGKSGCQRNIFFEFSIDNRKNQGNNNADYFSRGLAEAHQHGIPDAILCNVKTGADGADEGKNAENKVHSDGTDMTHQNSREKRCQDCRNSAGAGQEHVGSYHGSAGKIRQNGADYGIDHTV